MPETHTSSGVIPVYPDPDPEYLLLQYPQGHWGFPKGHLEDSDDTLWETAIRELKEETGLDATRQFEGFKETVDYWFTQDGSRHHKTVYFFGCEVASKTVTLSEEHQDYQWLETKKTRSILTYDNEKDLFDRWLDFFDHTNTERIS